MIFQFTPLHERQRPVFRHSVKKYKFQFTPLHERQLSPLNLKEGSCLFQFTPLHERQQDVVWPVWRWWYFNSRLCMRGNANQLDFSCMAKLISIHASAWEATMAATLGARTRIWFQFTPLHERQQAKRKSLSQTKYFNSRLCMRGNAAPQSVFWYPADFNSRLCMRGNQV